MTRIELILISLFIASLLFLLITLSLFILLIFKRNELKKISRKNKKKRRQLRKQQKKIRIFCIISFLFSLSFGLGTSYIFYYQSVNLSQEDQQAVVKGYYLLTDLNEQFEKMSDHQLSKNESIANIQTLGSSMASYSHQKASSLNTTQGQSKLNRYYNVMKELGINVTAKSQLFYDNQELIDEFLMDLDKLENHQQEVFKYYKVNESDLEKSK